MPSLELEFREEAQVVAVAQQIGTATTEIGLVAEIEGKLRLVPDLKRHVGEFAALDKVGGKTGRGSLHVLLPDDDGLKADARQHRLVADRCNEIVAIGQLVR